MIGVALDERADDIRPFLDGVEFPVLLDRDHLLAELYAISNVPTVVWIEADDRIARPNAAELGTDLFEAFSDGASSAAHRRAVTDWVRTGTVPDDAAEEVADLDDDELDARLAFRLAAHLRRRDDDRSTGWFERAAALAPFDFSVARASMPLTGRDPFGDEFMALFEEWRRAGAPIHGLAPHKE